MVGWIALIVVIGIAGYYLFRWQQRKARDPNETFIKPRLELSAMQITDMSKEKTMGNCILLIDNPAPVGFEADSLSYELYIAGEKVMESTYPKAIDLDANDSSVITLPVTIRNETLVQTLRKLEEQGADSTDYTMKTLVYTHLPFLKDKPLKLEISKELPVYRIPEVKLLDTDLDKLGLNQTKMTLKVEITNPNVFPYVFRDTYYQMTLNGDKFTEGSLPQVINIPAQGKATLDIPVEVKPKEAIQTGLRLLNKSKENTYSFVFQAKVVDRKGNKTFQDSKMKLQSEGDLRELLQEARKMAKEAKAEKKKSED